jgi:glyoxylase-like metal-dependent hydrolase (beta-lactamase superfamily II)/8-oxo-dGTP pyrophosphatase MutT (NUDIX family)
MSSAPTTREPSADAAAEHPPRPAATLVVVRDADVGIEVLLLRRAERGDHNSGAWVFPGGIVEAGDRDAAACCSGLDDLAASATLGLPHGGLAYYVAAVRECFEESGLLYACDAGEPGPSGPLITLEDEAAVRIGAWRGPLHHGERTLAELCRASRLKLALDRLVYFSHWLTPLGRTKRFDTRFFIAAAPAAQIATHDQRELIEQRWLKPADAIAQSETLKLMTPTSKTLEAIARFDSVQSLLDWARGPRDVPLVMPRIGVGHLGPRPVTPDEPAWAELGRIDPAGHGSASYDIRPGIAVRLSERIVRVSANNGNVMTGPGTNSYLVGGGERNEWAVIDPGPLDPAHVRALLAAAPGAIRWIFATHTHMDHSPATVALQAHTGAAVYGQRAAHAQWQDTSFVPSHALQGGERITLNEGTTLRVIHTPGHASNHVCYLLEEERLLFTGDHVMQSSTVVINPPDGDMAAYLASLRLLLDAPLDWLAPGHGFLMAQPRRAIEWIIDHRLKREAKVIDALRDLGPASIEALLSQVYDDVSERMHGVATRSLKAHLIKLRDEARAVESAGRWSIA